MFHLLKTLAGLGRPRTPARRPVGHRPCLEYLEDRLVPHDCAVQFSSAAFVADASARFAVIQVDRVRDPEGFITVQVSATNGTAKSGRDFKAVRHTFAWDDNDSSSRQLVIPLRHHARPGRTIMLKISHFNGTVPGSPTKAVLVLQG